METLVRLVRHGSLGAVLLIFASRTAFAQTLAVSGSPGLLRISSAIAGSQPTSVSNSTTTYTVSTGNPNRTYKITAGLNIAMPPNVTLMATLAAPAGATSLGAVARGNPSPLVINSATAGSAPTSVTASGTSYAITTNEANQKIAASLDQALPSGVTLEVALAAPGGATSAGNVALSTAASDVVTGISSVAASSLPITYRLSATAQAQMSMPEARTVTFTIVSGT